MSVLYKKPQLRTYSATDLLEEMGPCQNQYVEQSATLNPDADGYMTYDGAATYSLETSNTTFLVGDTTSNVYARGFLSFDISSIHSTVVSATLRVFEYSFFAGVSDFVPLIVDHVNFGTLEAGAGDFDGNDLTRNYTSTTDYNTGWKELDIKSAVQADIDAGRNTSQFRLRFNIDTDSDGTSDNVNFWSVDAADLHPELVVTYY